MEDDRQMSLAANRPADPLSDLGGEWRRGVEPKEGARLVRAFLQIDNPYTRDAIVTLVESLRDSARAKAMV